MKKLLIAVPVLALTACAYHSDMGTENRFTVDEYTSLFAPSVTLVTDKKTGQILPFGGQSAVSQLAGPASTVAGAALIGEGLSDSGDSVSSVNTNKPSASANASAVAKNKTSIDNRPVFNNVNKNLNLNRNLNSNQNLNLNLNKNLNIQRNPWQKPRPPVQPY